MGGEAPGTCRHRANPPTRSEIDRLRINGPDDPDDPLTTYYASDNEVGMQMRKGGVDGAEHAEHGSVAVMLGIDGHTMARVDVQVPYYWATGLSDVDVLSLAIAHLTTARDELTRLGAGAL